MDITKGNLDDISRPASSESSRPGSRVSSVVLSEGVRMIPDRTGALEVLSSELTETQVQQNIEENILDFPSENMVSDQDVSEKENKYLELQEAIMEMERLDRILTSVTLEEVAVRKEGKELHRQLWKDIKDHNPESCSVCSEAENTNNTSKDCSEEMDYEPVFGTQVPDQGTDLICRPENTVSGSEVGVHGKSSNSVEVGAEIKEVTMTESRQRVTVKNKNGQDFIKKNIELVSNAGSSVTLTEEEQKRLDELLKYIDEEWAYFDLTTKSELGSSAESSATLKEEEQKRLGELLKDIDEEGAYVDPTPKSELGRSLISSATLTKEEQKRLDELLKDIDHFDPTAKPEEQGYRPQAAELEQLLHIDAKLQLFLSVEEFMCVRSPYGYPSLSQVENAGDLGEGILRDIKESKEQEECLCEI
ncbi:fibrous sheath-interacting protein 1 [Tachysurus fulvidraco]|uniref:fibrous sheath-interacting protein 1 n=1 Tax=Tachysurus fulvidraco TaxID=1234273 RepID=UPI001FEF88EF|nr:fibrous sheath-interacting protein 1 [Tachysurus fulvidraco]